MWDVGCGRGRIHQNNEERMLDNWLRPIDKALTTAAARRPRNVGDHLIRYVEEFPNLEGVQIGLIGIGKKEADAVRKELYQMSWPFGSLRVADLGNVRRASVSFIVPVIKELLDSRIVPLLLCRQPEFMQSQYQAHKSIYSSLSLALIDEQVHYHPRTPGEERHFLQPVIDQPPAGLFHLSVLACQRHFIDPDLNQFLNERHFDLLRLGPLRADLTAAEPLIRDADLLAFNLAALKRVEAPGVAEPTPSGLFSEEACQLSRYAGMSDKLRSVGFFGYVSERDTRRQTASLLAQLVWYFLDGFHHRKNDFPVSTDGLVEYIVDFKGPEHLQLTFWRSNKSGRWWIQVPVDTKDAPQRHRLIPCSYQDYQQACNEEVPERLLNAFKRYG